METNDCVCLYWVCPTNWVRRCCFFWYIFSNIKKWYLKRHCFFCPSNAILMKIPSGKREERNTPAGHGTETGYIFFPGKTFFFTFNLSRWEVAGSGQCCGCGCCTTPTSLASRTSLFWMRAPSQSLSNSFGRWRIWGPSPSGPSTSQSHQFRLAQKHIPPYTSWPTPSRGFVDWTRPCNQSGVLVSNWHVFVCQQVATELWATKTC